MKICHCTSVHSALDIRIFHKECSSLAAAGHEVYLVTANPDDGLVNGVQFVSSHSKKRSRLFRILFTSREVYKTALALDADVYHLHDPELLPYALKLRRKKKVVIYDAHEDLPRQLAGKEYLRFKKTFASVVERYENYVCRKLSYIVTATPFIAERFKKINPNTLNINNYPLLSEIEVLDETHENRTNRVCFIGGISEIRGIVELISALEGLNVTLDLAGEIDPALKEKLSAMKGWEKVNELGFIDRKTSGQIRSKACAGIVTFLPLPNHVNAQPNKIFEYMGSGLPVIGSNFPLWKELIEKNKIGFCVDPKNPKEIREAIQFCLNNPAEVNAMGNRGRELVISTFNWSIEEKKLVVLYAQFAK